MLIGRRFLASLAKKDCAISLRESGRIGLQLTQFNSKTGQLQMDPAILKAIALLITALVGLLAEIRRWRKPPQR
jgi:hypothetical protein